MDGIIFAAFVALNAAALGQVDGDTLDDQCPAETAYEVAFRADTSSDQLIVRAGGPDCEDLSLEILDATGRQLFYFEPQSECLYSPSDYRRFAETIFVPGRDEYEGGASALPVGNEMPPIEYMYVPDYDLYDRAVETGGPLICFQSYDFGGACAWYDPDAQTGVLLFEQGS